MTEESSELKMTSATSPGRNRMIPNTTSDPSTSVGMKSSRRRTMYFCITLNQRGGGGRLT